MTNLALSEHLLPISADVLLFSRGRFGWRPGVTATLAEGIQRVLIATPLPLQSDHVVNPRPSGQPNVNGSVYVHV